MEKEVICLNVVYDKLLTLFKSRCFQYSYVKDILLLSYDYNKTSLKMYENNGIITLIVNGNGNEDFLHIIKDLVKNNDMLFELSRQLLFNPTYNSHELLRLTKQFFEVEYTKLFNENITKLKYEYRNIIYSDPMYNTIEFIQNITITNEQMVELLYMDFSKYSDLLSDELVEALCHIVGVCGGIGFYLVIEPLYTQMDQKIKENLLFILKFKQFFLNEIKNND